MKPQITVFIATSLDGYIARTNGDLDWLDAANETVPAGEDCGYQSLMERIDILVMGRRTYEKVLSFGKWPYGRTPVTVLSSEAITFPESIPDTVTHSSDAPVTLCQRLVAEDVRHIYVDGGTTIQRFLAAGLVDELIITIIPILLGSGIPLFGSLDEDIQLNCVGAQHYDFGFVQLKYHIDNNT